MKARYNIEKFTISLILICIFSFSSSQELNFLENQLGETKSCNTPVECYFEAISLVKRLQAELKTKEEELQKKFDAKEAELKKIFEDKYQSLVGITPVGQITFFSISKLDVKDEDLPKNWILCDGRALLRNEHPELFKILGNQYGNGDGQTTFNIPDLRGRVIVGSGQGENLNLYKPGDRGGEEKHTLSIEEMPSHAHPTSFMKDCVGVLSYPTGKTGGCLADWNTRYWGYTDNVGSSAPHNNLQPYLSIHPIIRIK
jgi:microcystin-dependent protein